jgi:hypothetical protein
VQEFDDHIEVNGITNGPAKPFMLQCGRSATIVIYHLISRKWGFAGTLVLSCGASTGAINRHNAQNALNQFSPPSYLPDSAILTHFLTILTVAISQDWQSVSDFTPTLTKCAGRSSYIYEEFHRDAGTDVKMYTVGPNTATRSTQVAGGRWQGAAQSRSAAVVSAILTFQEKEIARRIVLVFASLCVDLIF